MKNIMVFERSEKKYLLTKQQYLKLREKWENIQIEDKYGLTSICNVYYDSEDYRLIRTSLEKPAYKEKFRVRSYGIPTKDSTVFLEIKKKVQDVVYKRRIELKYDEAMKFLKNPQEAELNSQIAKEIKYMFQMYQLEPKMFVAYDRIATYNKNNPDIRVTFDFNLRNRENELDIGVSDRGNLLFDDEMVLMEIKVNQAIPLWMVKDFEELDIKPISFSKYGNFYRKKIMNNYYKETSKSMDIERMCKLCFQV